MSGLKLHAVHIPRDGGCSVLLLLLCTCRVIAHGFSGILFRNNPFYINVFKEEKQGSHEPPMNWGMLKVFCPPCQLPKDAEIQIVTSAVLAGGKLA